MSPGRSTLLTDKLRQTAVYWGDPQSDGAGGRTFGSAYPVELSIRWEERQELFVDASGQETMSQAVVYLDQDIDIGGYLDLGDLDDLSSAEESDPLTVGGAYEIRNFKKLPDIKADRFLRKVWL